MQADGVRRRRDFNITLDKDFVDSETLSTTSSMPGSNTIDNAKFPYKVVGITQIHRSVRYSTKLFHAQVEYSQYYSEYQRQNAMMLGLLDKLGVMFDPSIVWNAIPWSFAIDWVIDVGRWLSQFKAPNLEPVTVIHKFCWSQHVKRTIVSVVKPQRDNLPKSRGSDGRASSVTEDAYIRSTQGLNVVAALSGSGVNSKEFILASALAFSRYR
jgi:hypothetical protein